MNDLKDTSGERGGGSLERMVRRICKICGEPEDEHHEPDLLEIPAGCVCDWRTWDYDNRTKLPPACDKYEGDGKCNCQKCEHDAECHAPNAPSSATGKPDATQTKDL